MPKFLPQQVRTTSLDVKFAWAANIVAAFPQATSIKRDKQSSTDTCNDPECLKLGNTRRKVFILAGENVIATFCSDKCLHNFCRNQNPH